LAVGSKHVHCLILLTAVNWQTANCQLPTACFQTSVHVHQNKSRTGPERNQRAVGAFF